MKPNLLVTYMPSKEGSARAELEAVLEEIGEKPKFCPSKTEGVLLVNIKNPKIAVKKIIEIFKHNPSFFESTFRYVPIDKWTVADMLHMLGIIRQFGEEIKPHNRWKMHINKRGYKKMSKMDLIIKLTDIIDREHVDLNNPEKIIHIEILGKLAGMSLLRPQEFLEVGKFKK